MSPSPPWLKRAATRFALLVMLVLLALTLGTPADAAPAPIIIPPPARLRRHPRTPSDERIETI